MNEPPAADDNLNPNPPAHRNPQQQMRACYRLIAKMPTLAAMAYKTSVGQPIIYPRNDLSYCENFLHMMFAGEPPSSTRAATAPTARTSCI